MDAVLDAQEVKNKLGLVPHPCEGGWYIRTYEAAEQLTRSCFQNARYEGPRPTGTAIYYLLEPETFSEMHCLRSDEIFHFYAGDPVEMLQLMPNGKGRRVLIGNDLISEARPQVVVPKGMWQGSRLMAGGRWALLGCTVSPGFAFEDYEAGKRDELIAAWPEWAEFIVGLTR